ncbi:MAG: CUB domain-containing protein, partial [Flavobacteriales bacterium]|nr:CUB domain-containing protein [Flavobacteriales bacterium]
MERVDHRSLIRTLAIAGTILGLHNLASAQCGTTVYDTGGAGGNYANNQNYSVTYCPSVAGQVVTLTFSQFNTENGYDFLTVYNGSTTASPSLGTFSGTAIPGPFTSTDPSGCLTIRFISDGSLTYAGWTAAISCGAPPPPPVVCGTTVYDPGGSGGNYGNNALYTQTYCPTVAGQVVTLTFTSFSTEANYDFLTVYNGPTTASPVMGTFSGANIPGPFISTDPSGCITIRFTSDGSINYPGWAINITCSTPSPPLVVCGTTVYDPGGATGDYANSTSYTVTYCPSVAGQVVTLNFSQFATEAGVDNLTIYNGPTTASPAIGSYSGTTNPGTITSTAPGGCLTLRFISNGTNVAAGWAAAVTCALPPPSGSCGSLVYDPGGAGGNYANSTNWTATYCPTNPGDVVTLNFSQFDIENGYDVLYIHNGSTTGEPILGQYTGTGSPGSVTSTAPNGCLTLHFVSDGSITYPGWAASISCGPPPPPPNYCGTNVYDPGGPTGYYANNTTWTQTYCPTVPGEVVRINFIAFNTEAGFDFLTIYNGPSTASPILGTFSGTGNPGTIISSAPGGCLTLQLTSDGSINAPGWSAGITCIVPPPPPTGDCIYVLTLNDSFGDGWGTSRVGVSINGGPVQYYGATGSFFQVVFGVNINDLVTLTYVNTGPNQTQNSYSLSIQGQGSPLFTSGSPPAAGLQYAGLVDCVPPATPPQDCIGGITICSGQAFNNNSNNTGTVVDLTSSNQGCLNAGERQGTWYYFSPSAGGTIGFTITPTAPTDYDFAVWGPMAGVTCPPPGPPLRCSWAAPYGPTGCGNGATDVSEGAGGDRFVSTFNV